MFSGLIAIAPILVDHRIRWALPFMISVLLIFFLANDSDGQQHMSTLCRFTAGPRTGQTQDYAPMAPIPVGAPCHDGQGSTGVVVAAGAGSQSQGGAAGPLSNTCKFTTGPRAGQTQDYAPMAPISVGVPCHDGQGSTGVVVAAGAGSQPQGGAAGPLSNTCKFTTGPRAGQIQSYPNVSPIPVGSPCHDGQGSTGFAIPDR